MTINTTQIGSFAATVASLACLLSVPSAVSAQFAGDLPVIRETVEWQDITLDPAEGFAPTLPFNPPEPPFQRDRLIFFAHGLSGEANAWAPVTGNLRLRYETEPIPIEYGHLQEVDGSFEDPTTGERLDPATTLAANVELLLTSAEDQRDGKIDPAYTMYVGHSLGGIVGREIVRLGDEVLPYDVDDYRFRGLVTFSSPHGGAPVVTAEDEIRALFEDGCQALAGGPILEFAARVPNLIKFQGQTVFQTAQEFLDAGCTQVAFADLTDNLVLNKFLPPVSADLAPESDFITRLGEYREPDYIYTANIMAYETQPVTYRLITSGQQDVIKAPVFGATDDTDFENDVEDNIASYTDNAADLRDEADDIDHFEITIRPAGGGLSGEIQFARKRRARKLRTAADAYDRGADWWEGLNDAWLRIIGARWDEKIGELYRCSCIEVNGRDPLDPVEGSGNGEGGTGGGVGGGATGESSSFETSDPNACTSNDALDCSLTFLKELNQTFTKPTDGAANLDSQQSWNAQIMVEYEGSNHFQIRNDENTQNAFEVQLFGGGNRFFQTDRR